jgi:hypothetical protein
VDAAPERAKVMVCADNGEPIVTEATGAELEA